MRGRQARRFAKLAVFVALAAFLPGCPPAPPPSVLNRAIDSLTDVIARINANNRLIPTLWARQSFDGYIRDDQGHTQYVSADSGVLLYYGPSSMRLVANNEFGSVFEVGINSRDYWAIVYPQLSTFWYGKTANIGKPCVRPIPVRPDLLINMLGLGQINPKLLRAPYPVMRFNNPQDCYMIDFLVPISDRLVVEKEVWYDRQTLHPIKVLLYAPDGHELVSADLSLFQQVPVDGLSRAQWPTIASNFNLFFYDDGTTMHFHLRDIGLTNPGTHTIPGPNSIQCPDPSSVSVSHTIQLDAACGD